MQFNNFQSNRISKGLTVGGAVIQKSCFLSRTFKYLCPNQP